MGGEFCCVARRYRVWTVLQHSTARYLCMLRTMRPHQPASVTAMTARAHCTHALFILAHIIKTLLLTQLTHTPPTSEYHIC